MTPKQKRIMGLIRGGAFLAMAKSQGAMKTNRAEPLVLPVKVSRRVIDSPRPCQGSSDDSMLAANLANLAVHIAANGSM